MTAKRWLSLFTLFACFPLMSISTHAQGPKTDLFYLVVDQSGSIAQKGLKEPVKQAISELIQELDVDTHVELVLFNDKASKPQKWYPLDQKNKADFGRYFNRNFNPGSETRLYDTVAEAIKRVVEMESQFRHISLLILSDGDDNKSKEYTSWDQIEALIPDHWHNIPKSELRHRVVLLTVKHTPKPQHQPRPGGPVQMTPNLGADEIAEWFLPPPSAKFTAHPLKIRAGESVFFILDYPMGVSTVQWTLGDGSQYDVPSFTHTFPSEGAYDVSVEVEGSRGRKDKELRPEYIQVVPVVPLEAGFTWHPESPKVGEMLIFTDESIGAPEGWVWSINGAERRKDRNPRVSFDSPGRKQVILTVSKEGESISVTNVISVAPPLPTADFDVSNNELNFGESLKLSASGTETDWKHTWAVGEGVSLDGPSVTWVADQSGRIEVVHTVQSPGGTVHKPAIVFVREKPEPLVPEFNWSPTNVRAGSAVQLIDESKGAPQSWTWSVDDGQSSSDRNPSFVFNDAGTVNLTLTISRGEERQSLVKAIEILPPLVALQASFKTSTTRGRHPLEVSFEDTSKGAVASWLWDFGDGNQSDQKNPVHTYREASSYNPRLFIRDSLGNEARDAGTTKIEVRPPLAGWIKVLVLLAVLAIAWMILARTLLVSLISPTKTAVLKTATATYNLGRIAAKKSSLFWPRSYVTLGSQKGDDIAVTFPDGARVQSAVIWRSAATKSYRLEPRKGGRVYAGSETTDPMTGKSKKQWSDMLVATSLRNGMVFRIGDVDFEWNQK